MAVNITSAYAGEVLEALLTKAATGNELVAGGHIRIEPNVRDKFYIPRLKAGSMLQKRIEQPVDGDSKGDFTIDEKLLEPKEFMAFTTFNPRSFEKFWRGYQPKGNLVFTELPAEAQNKLLAELAKQVNFELGDYYINGVFGAGANQLFNGILTKIVADTAVLKVTTPVALTEANIIAKLKLTRALIPKAVRKQNSCKIFMSIEDFDLYDDAMTALASKGVDSTGVTKKSFKEIPIVTLAAWPKDVVVIANASMDLDTNFWGAVSLSDDENVIQIDKLTNAGEKYFFKMLMKADTNTAFGEEIVLYNGRA